MRKSFTCLDYCALNAQTLREIWKDQHWAKFKNNMIIYKKYTRKTIKNNNCFKHDYLQKEELFASRVHFGRLKDDYLQNTKKKYARKVINNNNFFLRRTLAQ